MSITSLNFALFVIAVVIIYYLMPKKTRWVVLLISSYVFYGFFGLKYLVFILITTLSTYLSASFIYNEHIACKLSLAKAGREEKRVISNSSKRKRKRYLVFSLLLNFGILVFFKYFDITKAGLFAVTGNQAFNTTSHLILPLGISFYMFQSVGYMVDVYWGKYKAENNIFKFALFVSFFPQIIQGPISRYKDLAPQLFEGQRWDDETVRDGVYSILLGLFKKMIIADRLAVLVTAVIGEYGNYSGSIVFASMLIYGVQIYCDFSGGIDIVSGVAKFFSINLTPNFRRPLFATSISDFWRRWHITLGSWMRDYVFYPLSLSKWLGKLNKKSRKELGPKLGKLVTISISSLIVYILVGLWHGPSLKYIVFGLWHGMIISTSLATEDMVKSLKTRLHIRDKALWWRLVQIAITTFLVTIGRYFSRAESLRKALSMIKHTVLEFNISALFKGGFSGLDISGGGFTIAIAGFAGLMAYEILSECDISIKTKFEKSPAALQFVSTFVFVCILIYFGFYSKGFMPREFIYMQY